MPGKNRPLFIPEREGLGMQPILPLFIILLLIPFSFSLEMNDSKMEKISNSFEDPTTYEPGTLIVSFTPTTTFDEAKTLLEKYGLVIRSGEKCTTESYGGPGQETVETQKCLNSEEWNDSLKVAVVSVPAGQEKMEALELIQEPTIAAVEPNYIVYATGENNPNPATPPAHPNEMKIDPVWLGVGFLLVLIIFLGITARNK